MGERKIVFLDDSRLSMSENLTRVFHEALKHPANPLLRPDEPWEGDRVYVFGAVLPHAGGFRMWYQTCSNALEGPDKAVVCVADSGDLVHWHKAVGIGLPFRGLERTNIVFKCTGPKPLYTPSVIRDRGEIDPTRRFKMLVWDGRGRGRGGCAAFSDDGVAWRRAAENPVFSEPNDVLVARRGAEGSYECYQTLLVDDPSQDYPRDNLRGRRRIIGLRRSTDFVKWSEAVPLLAPDAGDPPDLQFYGMGVGAAGDYLVGLLWRYRAESQTSDVGPAWSSDGIRWRRAPIDRPLIRLGPRGAFDSHMVFTASAPLTAGGRENVLYGAFDGPHDSHTRKAAIGLATLREDGWCSLDAGEEEGVLVTTALDGGIEDLALNIDCSAAGAYCLAELIDDSGAVAPGYGKEFCVPISGADSLRASLLWRSAGPAPAQGARLRLFLRRASLFAVVLH